MSPPYPRRLASLLKGAAGFAFALTLNSCVSLVTPEQTAIRPHSKPVSPVGITVADHRTNTAGGRKDRYYGRCRLGLYGIPTPILDPKLAVAERLGKQLEAGYKQSGVEVRVTTTNPFSGKSDVVASFANTGVRKILLVRLDDVWMDFANPLTGNESILYFDATAEVLSPSGASLGSAKKKYQKNFRYDANDSLFNQAVKTLQPEFSTLVNEPAIRRALAP